MPIKCLFNTMFFLGLGVKFSKMSLLDRVLNKAHNDKCVIYTHVLFCN
jgi:hypothetical protein